MQSSHVVCSRSLRTSDVSKSSSKSDRVIFLKPFGNQVSGRANILTFNSTTICKPYVSRELFFYHHLPQVFKTFVPDFKGLINVTYVENEDDSAVTAIAHTKSLVKRSSNAIKSLVETPRPHSKRCVHDYGRTHVIDPSNPRVVSLRPKNGVGGEFSHSPEADVFDELTQGFDANVSIQALEAKDCRVQFKEAESYQQQNPWNSKVMADVWTKLKNAQSNEGTSTRSKRFMLLENVTASYRRPCILDLKVGTRVRENASPAKLARHVTAIDVGVRMSGMQIYDSEHNNYLYINKYYGHNLSVDGLVSNLIDFFSRGHSPIVRLGGAETQESASHKEASTGNHSEHELKKFQNLDCHLLDSAIRQLLELRHAVASLVSYRFYSGSLLLVYEGDDNDSDALCNPEKAECSKRPNATGNSSHEKSADVRYRHSKMSKHSYGKSASRPRSYPSARGDSCVPEDVHGVSRNYRSPMGRGIGNPSYSKAALEDRHHSPIHRSVKEMASKRRHRTKSCGSLANCFLSNCQEPSSSTKSNPIKSSEDAIDVRLIDFAHYCFSDSVVHPGPDGGFLFGIDSLIKLLRKMSINVLLASDRNTTELNSGNPHHCDSPCKI